MGVGYQARRMIISPQHTGVRLISFQFNPVELALSLLDDDSQGKDMGSFSRTKNMLERALKGTIERE